MARPCPIMLKMLPIRLFSNAHVFTFDSHLLGFNSYPLDLVIINESNITEDLLAHYIDDRLKKFFSKKTENVLKN